jgi:hypothetical protein
MRARAFARVIAMLGAVAIGAFLCRAAPRDVTLVYDLSALPGATGVEVEIRRDGELVRRAELSVAAGASQVRHAVRLPDGRYDLVLHVATAAGTVRVTRAVDVSEEGTIVLPISR